MPHRLPYGDLVTEVSFQLAPTQIISDLRVYPTVDCPILVPIGRKEELQMSLCLLGYSRSGVLEVH
jgi:hypothetical protein